MKDFCSMELVRDNKSGSCFLKLLLSSLIIIFNSLKIQPWASVSIATRGELRTVPIEDSFLNIVYDYIVSLLAVYNITAH